MEMWDRRCQSVADGAGFSSSCVCAAKLLSGEIGGALITLRHSCTCPAVVGRGKEEEEEGLCHFRFAFVDSDFLELCRERRRCTQRSFLTFLLKCVCVEQRAVSTQ